MLFELLQVQGSATDTGIHITLSGAVLALIAEKLWDKMRSNGGNGLKQLIKEQTEILKQILAQNVEIAKDIAVMKAIQDRQFGRSFDR